MLCDAMLALYLLFFPLFSLVDLETDAAPMIDYVDDDPLLARATRQAPLITRYRLFFSILLALEECSMLLLSVNPILMHSLPLLLQLLPLPAILLLSI